MKEITLDEVYAGWISYRMITLMLDNKPMQFGYYVDNIRKYLKVV